MIKLELTHEYNSWVKVLVDWYMFDESFWNKAKIDDILKLIDFSDEKNRKTIWINAKGHSNVVEIINAKNINTRVKMLNKWIDWVVIKNLDRYKDKISVILPVADCAAITFSNQKWYNIWIIHAWWEWISKDIIWNLINKLKIVNTEWLDELQFYIWPMAWKWFEFWKKDYFKSFYNLFDKWNSYWLSPHNYFEEISTDKWYLNLRKMILDIFILNWIKKDQIIFSDIETNSPNNNWPSYRENWTDKRIWIFLEN